MKNNKKLLALTLAVVMVLAMFAGCNKTGGGGSSDKSTPLVVAYSPFSEKFSPFFAETTYDVDAEAMTQIKMMTMDRMGGIVYNAIKGETIAYNGTDYTYTGPCDIQVKYDSATDITTYTVKVRDDIKFSDGKPVTADDMLFTYYVYLDPAYVGSTTLNSYDIIGLSDYQNQATAEITEKYTKLAGQIFAAGKDHVWSSSDAWTEEQQKSYWDDCMAAAGARFAQDIVSSIVADYGSDDYVKEYFSADLTAADCTKGDAVTVAYSMAMWGFGEMNDSKVFVDFNGVEHDVLNGAELTTADFWQCIYDKYKGDFAAIAGEKAGDLLPEEYAAQNFVRTWGPKDENSGGAVTSVSGITKLDEYTVQVQTTGYSAPAVYSICGLEISPKHYYGDEKKWKPEEGLYGHDFDDLTEVESKTNAPMGAGAYKFVKFENKVVYFEANENYYKGAPKIKYVQFKETTAAEVAAAVKAGTVDAGEMTGSKKRFDEVKSFNSNSNISGDVITTSKVDFLGYGYIGVNALKVNVGGDANSDASKNLRKALATVLAVYRDSAVDSYYGEAASVIQYPISNTSWAAPQATDEDYHAAFSLDVDGKEIYTSDMTSDQKYAAALEAALGYFKAAGYTVENGKVTAAPSGARLEYEIIIPADGSGDHPSFAVLTDAQAALATIGITLKINDPADSNVLWNALDADEQDMWCAAWQATVDPDMYQVYHSSSTVTGSGTSTSNHYNIALDALDKLIVDARKSDDQAYRKVVYKQALDMIVDFAVEIPVYQRQNCVVFSTARIDMDTMTPDITTYWTWMSEIETLEMK